MWLSPRNEDVPEGVKDSKYRVKKSLVLFCNHMVWFTSNKGWSNISQHEAIDMQAKLTL